VELIALVDEQREAQAEAAQARHRERAEGARIGRVEVDAQPQEGGARVVDVAQEQPVGGAGRGAPGWTDAECDPDRDHRGEGGR